MHEEFLRQIPMFAKLTDLEIAQLAQTMRLREVPSGTVLCREGTRGDHSYIIVSGQVDIVKDLDGEPRVLSHPNIGDFIGEMSLFDPEGLRTASTLARTDSQVLELNHADLDLLLHQHPMMAYEIMRELSLRLRNTDNAIIRDLQDKNFELAQAYAELKEAHEQIVEKEKLEHELQVAGRIQRSILPNELPQVPGFDLGACMDPARAVSGDFFDIIPLTRDRVAITIGDVSDKGVPAAIFMALCRSLIRAASHAMRSPAQVLERVNKHLLGMNEMGMFVTVLYGVLDRRAGHFRYARAGHELPLVIYPEGHSRYLPQGRGQLLGILTNPVFDERVIPLKLGEMVFLYTDGAPDARDEQGIRLGYEGLSKLAVEKISSSSQETCDNILQEILQRQGRTVQFDDILLVAGRMVA